MAGTTASLAKTTLDGVVQKVATIAVDEVARMLGVRQDVWYIRGELEMMQSFLIAADSQQDDNILVSTWVRQVKDLAYQIEDCLAEFSFHLENRGLCYRLLTLGARRRIASSIRDIRRKVEEVSKRNLRYNLIKPLGSSSDATSKYVNLATRMTALVVEETELIDVVGQKNKLIEMINERNKHRKVIWVIGMGGLGKTTLVRKVFESPEVSKNFSCRVWVTVSQTFNPKDLLREILKKILTNKEEEIRIKDEELILSVRSELEKKVYVVVLDDLWTTQAWDILEKAFPNNEKGSKVIVTTRNTNVAEHCNWNLKKIYTVEPLSDESSRHLLLRKIYKSNDFSDRHRSDLKEATDQIIKKCGGVPLVIVTIGGLLATKPIIKEEWEKLLNHLGSELETNPTAETTKQILDLSYHDLPYYLKPCLLYLSIFPEDFEIKCNRLVYRWMAEGFVRERRGMTPEEVAKEYFYELINRNLIQPSRVGSDGTIKRCRVHDVLHELLIAKSIDENLVFITGEQENMTLIDSVRHLIITRSIEMRRTNLQNIRSISIFNADVPSILSSHSKLKLQYVENEHDDDKTKHATLHLGQFEHLKYISLPGGCSVEILKSLGNLRNLQTLLTRYVETLPNTITKLQKLRHLESTYKFEGVRMPRGIGKLKELQELKSVNLKRSHPRLVEEIAQLRQLRELGVIFLNRGQYEKFSASISQLSFLRSLDIQLSHSGEAAVGLLDTISSPPEHLRSIKLEGWIGKLPAWVSSRYNLATVTLQFTGLHDDAIVYLQELPNLLLLRLLDVSYNGTKLSFRRATFPKLRAFYVAALDNLEELLFEEGTLPELQTLDIYQCKLMSGISGTIHLPRLKKLALRWWVYVANLDLVKKEIGEHRNHPTLEVWDPESPEEERRYYYLGNRSGGSPADDFSSSSSDPEEMEKCSSGCPWCMPHL